jgi:hypothetical protein
MSIVMGWLGGVLEAEVVRGGQISTGAGPGQVAPHDHRRRSAGRVRRADRAGVRQFRGQFRGRRLGVALEAATGWRFLVAERRATLKCTQGRVPGVASYAPRCRTRR